MSPNRHNLWVRVMLLMRSNDYDLEISDHMTYTGRSQVCSTIYMKRYYSISNLKKHTFLLSIVEETFSSHFKCLQTFRMFDSLIC